MLENGSRKGLDVVKNPDPNQASGSSPTPDFLLSYVKVQVKGQKTVYLEQAKYVKDQVFISGYEIDKHGEPVLDHGQSIKHLIQIGPGVKITNMVMHPKYGELEVSHPKEH